MNANVETGSTLVQVALPVLTALVAGALSYFGARYQGRMQALSENERQERELLTIIKTSVAEISGTALDIKQIRERVDVLMPRSDFEGLFEEISKLMEGVSLPTLGSPPAREPLLELLSVNPALGRRVASNIGQKQALGDFLRLHARPGESIILDCGTTVAWAMHRLLASGMEFSSILTNNVLVAAMCGDANSDQVVYDVLMADELPSACRLIPGTYFPSYAAIFPDNEDSLSAYLGVGLEDLGWILVGSTSLELRTGPRGRSKENRRFKAALLDEGLKRECQVVVLVDVDKLGLQLGEPADQEAWKALLASTRLRVVVAGDPRVAGGQSLIRAREEIRKYEEGRNETDWSLALTFVGLDGREIPHGRIMASSGLDPIADLADGSAQ